MPIIPAAQIQAAIRRRHPQRGNTAVIAMYSPKAQERISLVRNKLGDCYRPVRKM
jgi:hypothetical protein